MHVSVITYRVNVYQSRPIDASLLISGLRLISSVTRSHQQLADRHMVIHDVHTGCTILVLINNVSLKMPQNAQIQMSLSGQYDFLIMSGCCRSHLEWFASARHLHPHYLSSKHVWRSTYTHFPYHKFCTAFVQRLVIFETKIAGFIVVYSHLHHASSALPRAVNCTVDNKQ